MSKIWVITRIEYHEGVIDQADETTTVVAAFTDEAKADAYMSERRPEYGTSYDKTELTVDA